MKGTVKRLTDTALFVSISGNVDGVVWPNHFADIHLKHPQKRFKPGGSIKCRVSITYLFHNTFIDMLSRSLLLILTARGSSSQRRGH